MREYKTSKDYYTVKDVMELIGKKRRVISTMIEDGRLPKPSIDGRLLVWKRFDLDRWIKNEKHLKH